MKANIIYKGYYKKESYFPLRSLRYSIVWHRKTYSYIDIKATIPHIVA